VLVAVADPLVPLAEAWLVAPAEVAEEALSVGEVVSVVTESPVAPAQRRPFPQDDPPPQAESSKGAAARIVQEAHRVRAKRRSILLVPIPRTIVSFRGRRSKANPSAPGA